MQCVRIPCVSCTPPPLQWRHNEHDGASNRQPHDSLLNSLFRRRSKKTSKFRVTGLCAGIHWWPVNSPHKGPVTRKCFHLMTSSCSKELSRLDMSCQTSNLFICVFHHSEIFIFPYQKPRKLLKLNLMISICIACWVEYCFINTARSLSDRKLHNTDFNGAAIH